MKQSYYLYRSGRIQRKDNTLEIVYKDNTKKSIPVERVDDIYVMSEFDFNGKFVEFMYANVKDADSYQRYLNDELERNKKYIDPSNKKAWGAKEVRTINNLGTQK